MSGRIIFIFLLILVGCTRPIEPRALNKPEAPSITHVLLSDTLKPSDIRSLFRSLNQKRTLSALKPWLEDPSDSELEWLSGFLSKHFFEEALNREGLLSQLEESIVHQEFKKAEEEIQTWNTTPVSRSEKSLLWAGINSAHLKNSLKKLAPIFSPELDPFFESISLENRDQILAKARDIFANPKSKKFVLSHLDLWRRQETVSNLLLGITNAHEELGSAAFAELSTFTDLSRLSELLDRPSNGLFTHFQKSLKSSPDDLRLLSTWLEPLLIRTASMQVWTSLVERESGKFDRQFWLNLSSNPKLIGKEFKEVFSYVMGGLESLTNPSRNLINVPLYLHVYALTKTIAHAHSDASVQEALKKTSPTHSLEILWNQPFVLSALDFDLSEKTADGNFVVVENFKALGLVEVARTLEFHLRAGDFERTHFSLEASTESLKKRLHSCLTSSHKTLPLGDATALFVSVVNALDLEQLETPNILESLLRYSSGLSTEITTRQLSFLLEDLKLHQIDSETQEILLKFFAPDEQKWFRQLLAELPKIDLKAVPLLQNILQSTSANQMAGLSKGFIFLASLPLETFEGLVEQIASGIETSKDRRQVVTALSDTFLSLDVSWPFFEDVLAKNPEALAAFGSSTVALAHWFSPGLRKWAASFMQTPEFDAAYDYLKAHGSRENGRQVVKALTELSSTGALKDAFALLAKIQSDRMRKTAEVLSQWEKSGEFLAFLRSLDVLLTP